MPKYDLDQLAGEFEPLVVTFRGVEYTLGVTVQQMLGAISAARKVADNAALEEQFKLLPEVMGAACPALGTAITSGKPLSFVEHMLLQKTAEQLMKRMGEIPFRSLA
jgi:hypothetical protein